MRRCDKSLFLAAAILAASGLVAGCGSTTKGAIASLAPSRTASFSPTQSAILAPSETPSAVPSETSAVPSETPSAVPSPTVSAAPSPSPAATSPAPAAAQGAATPAPTTSPAPSSGSGLLWLWVLLGAAVLVGLIVWIARSARRRSAAATDWRSRVIDAYAKGSALHDAMSVAETPGGLAAGDAAARWSDIQRRADDLAQLLYGMREAAPDEDSRARVTDVLGSLQAIRSAMDAERAPGGAGAQQAEVVRGRLFTFEASLHALRATDGSRA